MYPVEIEYSGVGTKVIEQSPKAGEKIDVNSKVRLLLGE
ncbi:MAG: PASTA domain-containing protein [Bacilli bacterium]|nr:PASTA domain-containing protein [Bacilli bacterium]